MSGAEKDRVDGIDKADLRLWDSDGEGAIFEAETGKIICGMADVDEEGCGQKAVFPEAHTAARIVELWNAAVKAAWRTE